MRLNMDKVNAVTSLDILLNIWGKAWEILYLMEWV
jgi:hypothetical protein